LLRVPTSVTTPARPLGSRAAVIVCALAAGVPSFAASADASGAPAFRVRTLRFVDDSRTIRLPGGRRVPRPLVTVVRSPATRGAHPLIVFGHGYALTPATYTRLLNAWARAGYVVAAPLFPLGNAHAPGGPDESDLVNQPRDISFVIASLLALSGNPNGVLAGAIDPSSIAVAGHSDGADRRTHNSRVSRSLPESSTAAGVRRGGPASRHHAAHRSAVDLSAGRLSPGLPCAGRHPSARASHDSVCKSSAVVLPIAWTPPTRRLAPRNSAQSDSPADAVGTAATIPAATSRSAPSPPCLPPNKSSSDALVQAPMIRGTAAAPMFGLCLDHPAEATDAAGPAPARAE
jgi:chlorophyllase-like protein